MKCSYKQVEVQISWGFASARYTCNWELSLAKLPLSEATWHFYIVNCDTLRSSFLSALQIPELFKSNKSFWWIIVLIVQRQLWHIFLNILFPILNSKSFLHPQMLTLLSLKKNSKQGFSIFSFKKSLCNNLMIELISVCTGTSLGLKFIKAARSTHLHWFYIVYRKG